MRHNTALPKLILDEPELYAVDFAGQEQNGNLPRHIAQRLCERHVRITAQANLAPLAARQRPQKPRPAAAGRNLHQQAGDAARGGRRCAGAASATGKPLDGDEAVEAASKPVKRRTGLWRRSRRSRSRQSRHLARLPWHFFYPPLYPPKTLALWATGCNSVMRGSMLSICKT